MTSEREIEKLLVARTKDFIDDTLYLMIAKRGESPRVVSEAMARAFYDSLFEAAVRAEAYAGRLPLGASSRSVRSSEAVHEKVAHRILEMVTSDIQLGSKFLWTAWISKRQKPL